MVSELPLPSGRRADLVALGGDGEILIVEIKSSVADFRADQKWMDYRLHCDRLFFATIVDVPCEIFPADAGLIVADAFGASICLKRRSIGFAAARRKTVMLRFAHAAALRLQALADARTLRRGRAHPLHLAASPQWLYVGISATSLQQSPVLHQKASPSSL